MSLLLYTNFSALRHHFLETFYHKTEEKEEQQYESNLSLKSRHSNFAILGRLLLESVQWFGSKINNNNNNNIFYHIINTEKIIFNSIKMKINIPFSCSINNIVILNKNIEINNENNNGMILKLKGYNNVCYFNNSFLSKFINEQETFFFGGESNSLIIFDDIIDCKMGYKYNIFLKGLNILYTMVNGDWYKSENNINNKLKLLVKDLILFQLKQTNYINNNTIPNYICKLLSVYCLNMKQITIDWTSLNQIKHKKYNNWNGFVFLKDIFCYNNNDEYLWIKLNILYYLFPNMTCIKIITTRHSNLYLSQFMLNEIFSFISKYNQCKLNELQIKKPMETQITIQNAIDKYYHKFRKINWNIKQTLDKKKDKYLIVHKM